MEGRESTCRALAQEDIHTRMNGLGMSHMKRIVMCIALLASTISWGQVVTNELVFYLDANVDTDGTDGWDFTQPAVPGGGGTLGVVVANAASCQSAGVSSPRSATGGRAAGAGGGGGAAPPATAHAAPHAPRA